MRFLQVLFSRTELAEDLVYQVFPEALAKDPSQGLVGAHKVDREEILRHTRLNAFSYLYEASVGFQEGLFLSRVGDIDLIIERELSAEEHLLHLL